MTKFTEKAIKEAFVELLNQKPLNQITVQELVDRCGINRNTFYYHFANLEALVEELMMEQASLIMAAHPTLDSIESCIYAILDFVQENRQAIMNVYQSVNRVTCEKYLWIVARRMVEGYFETAAQDGVARLEPQDREVLTDYYVSIVFGLAMHWLNTGMSAPVAAESVKRLHNLMFSERAINYRNGLRAADGLGRQVSE